MSEYADLARARWVRGVIEFRGGDARIAFMGDPIREGLEETLDLRNYAGEARRQGRIGWLRHVALAACGRIAFELLRGALR